MSQENVEGVRRAFGLTTRLWYRRGLSGLARELGADEAGCVYATASCPPMTSHLDSMDSLGFLMATDRRLVFVNRTGEREIALPLDSIRRVEARRFPNRVLGREVVFIEADAGSFEFAVHSDWPRQRARTALAALEAHIRPRVEARGPSE